jgi:menaquinone-9 beta-reductase
VAPRLDVDTDVAIVGAGPAGLAVATFAARAGLRAVVCERSAGPLDKACGEGLMPAGLRVLTALGARDFLGPEDCSPIEGIRYVEEDGATITGKLPAGGGLGIRRTALAAALARTAEGSGVEIRWGTVATGFERREGAVRLQTSAGVLEGRILVVADGLHSPLRKSAGLDGPVEPRERFGLRQHFRLPPWSRFVEVHLSPGVEAFVTPAGASRVGVAFLWERAEVAGTVSFEVLLRRFPGLAERLSGALPDSEPRGAGPFAHAVRSRISERLVLAGDAAGYVDAITGEGLSMAFVCAEKLGALLPSALGRGATRHALEPYERAASREFSRYALVCRSVLALARRPRLRRQVLRLLRYTPGLFDRILSQALA